MDLFVAAPEINLLIVCAVRHDHLRLSDQIDVKPSALKIAFRIVFRQLLAHGSLIKSVAVEWHKVIWVYRVWHSGSLLSRRRKTGHTVIRNTGNAVFVVAYIFNQLDKGVCFPDRKGIVSFDR